MPRRAGHSKALRCALGLVAAFSVCLVSFTLLKVLAFCLSPEPMQASLAETAQVLADEGGNYWRLREGNLATQVDNWGCSIACNVSGHGRGVRDAFLDAYYLLPASPGAPDYDQVESLRASVGLRVGQDGGDGGSWVSYARYWHGYAVIMRPLLAVFGITHVRIVLMVACGLLMAALVASLARVRVWSGIAVVLALLLAGAPVSLMSVANSFPLLVSLGACLVVVGHMRKGGLQPQRLFDWPFWAVVFFVSGALTTYLDLLGFPLVSLGLPLALLVYLGADAVGPRTVKRATGTVALSVVCWGAGYGLLWVSKWVLSSLVTGTDVVADAMGQVLVRSGADGGAAGFGAAQAIGANVAALLAGPVKWVLLVLVLAFAISAVARHAAVRSVNWAAIVLFAAIALVPYAWYAVTANHSAIHFWFTYREQAVTLCAAALGALLVLQAGRRVGVMPEPDSVYHGAERT